VRQAKPRFAAILLLKPRRLITLAAQGTTELAQVLREFCGSRIEIRTE